MVQAAEVRAGAWDKARHVSDILSPRRTDHEIAVGDFKFINSDSTDPLVVRSATISIPDGTKVTLLRYGQDVGTLKQGFDCLAVETSESERWELTENNLSYRQPSGEEQDPPTYGYTWRRDGEGRGILRYVQVQKGSAQIIYEFPEGGDEHVTVSDHKGDLSKDFPERLTGEMVIGVSPIPWMINFDEEAEDILARSQLDRFQEVLIAHFREVLDEAPRADLK